MRLFSIFPIFIASFLLFACKKEEESLPLGCNIIFSFYTIDKEFVDTDTSSIYPNRTILLAHFRVVTKRNPPPADPCGEEFLCEYCSFSAFNVTDDTVRCKAFLGDTMFVLKFAPKVKIDISNLPRYCKNPNMSIFDFEYF